jgi:superfamily II DNA/RNA helicase
MYKRNNSSYQSDRGGGDNRSNGGSSSGGGGSSGYQNNGDRGKARLRKLDRHKNTNESMSDNYEFVNKLSDLVEHDDVKCTPDIIEMECTNFEEFNEKNGGLKQDLLEGIYAYGFEKPSKIQGCMIEPMLHRKDIIAQSQSGTGKTGGFMIPALQIIDDKLEKPQVIVVAPTTELAHQIKEFGENISQQMNIKFSYSVGKTDRQKNADELFGSNGEEVCKVLSGTPGRLVDLIINHNEAFSDIKLVILDECDNLLSGTFKDDLYQLFNNLPKKADEKIQICLISATFRKDVYELSEQFLENPSKILLKQDKLTLDGIKQRYILVNNENMKNGMLEKILSVISVSQLVVYVNTKNKCGELRDFLIQNIYDESDVMTIHGDLEKSERFKILKNFEAGNGKCLIATDLLARGIDIQQLSLIINYELPTDERNFGNYIHRIGRTGRFGKKGTAINFITRDEEYIQDKLKMKFRCDIEPLNKEELKNMTMD